MQKLFYLILKKEALALTAPVCVHPIIPIGASFSMVVLCVVQSLFAVLLLVRVWHIHLSVVTHSPILYAVTHKHCVLYKQSLILWLVWVVMLSVQVLIFQHPIFDKDVFFPFRLTISRPLVVLCFCFALGCITDPHAGHGAHQQAM